MTGPSCLKGTPTASRGSPRSWGQPLLQGDRSTGVVDLTCRDNMCAVVRDVRLLQKPRPSPWVGCLESVKVYFASVKNRFQNKTNVKTDNFAKNGLMNNYELNKAKK